MADDIKTGIAFKHTKDGPMVLIKEDDLIKLLRSTPVCDKGWRAFPFVPIEGSNSRFAKIIPIKNK